MTMNYSGFPIRNQNEIITLHYIMPTQKFIGFLFVFLLFNLSLTSQDDKIKSLKNYYKRQDKLACLTLFSDPAEDVRQIILIRHGEPDLDKKGWRNRHEAIQYMKDYDSVGVLPFPTGPICAEGLPVTKVHHSSIERAKSTAQLAYGQYNLISSYEFREFGKKTMKFCNIKMPLKFWTAGSRILWLMGLNDKGIESFREAKARAQANANFLEIDATMEGPVILVAHGLHNKYVKKYLKRMGWKKVKDNGSGYLSVKIMARKKNE